MPEVALPPDQLALYIALPIVLFVVLVLCICYCYRLNLLCFQQTKSETLLSDNKVRFTVDLSKKGRKKGRGLKFQSEASANIDKNDTTKGFVLSPMSNPTYVQTPAVGQIRGNTLKRLEESSTTSEIRFHSQEDKLVRSPTTSCMKPDKKRRLSSEGDVNLFPENVDRLNTEGSSVSVQSENTLLATRSSHSYPFFFYSTASSSMQSKSPHSPRQITQREFQGESDEFVAYGTQRKGLETSGTMDGLQTILKIKLPPISSFINASAARRRSSMQMPIDLRQINPKMYEFQKQRCPSTDFDASEEKPMLHFTLEFTPELEVLAVKIIQARNLQAQDFSGTTDPYVTVAILPGHSRKSKIHRKTTNPEFEESFVFRIESEDALKQVLEIKSYDFDQFSRDECTGVIRIYLEELDFEMTRLLDLWKPFEPYKCSATKDNEGCGHLLLALSYLSSAEKLTVAIQKARNLRLPEGRRSFPDTYVKVCVMNEGQRIKKKKTSVIASSNNPVFNQALTFNIANDIIQSHDVSVVCFVVNEFKMGHNLYLGQLELGPACDDPEEKNHWDEMLSQAASKPLARWHSLKRPIVGDDDAVAAGAKTAVRRKSVAAVIAQAEKLHVSLTGAPVERRSFS